jgi:hypothetical protein
VDAVVIFDEDDPAAIIRAIQPDVLVKGADWACDKNHRPRDGRSARRPRGAHEDRGRLVVVVDHREDFRVVLHPTSSLAFRALLKTAAQKAGVAKPAARLTGLTPAATAFHAAAVAQDHVVFLVAPTDADVEQLVSDARFFLAATRGLSESEAEQQALPFPSQEVDPYRELAPHLEVASARARALHALASGTARLVVASARAPSFRVSATPRAWPRPASASRSATRSPRKRSANDSRSPASSPRTPVDEHGEFCVRGGVVDFYPTAEAQPVRLEFVGDIIESVRRYDAATQRSLTALDRIAVSPQRELLPESGRARRPAMVDRTATIIDYVRHARSTLIVLELEDIDTRGRALDEQWRKSAADMEARGRVGCAVREHRDGQWDDVDTWLSTGARLSHLH